MLLFVLKIQIDRKQITLSAFSLYRNQSKHSIS